MRKIHGKEEAGVVIEPAMGLYLIVSADTV